MAVHPVADAGFGSEAERYERARPGYPPAVVDWLAGNLRLGGARRVMDLAAGTGKLTRSLVRFTAGLVAVEPVDGMRRVLGAALPGVPVVAGTAEALPFAAASFDAVTVAQAFHWFDADAAFAELARVVRPGGRVGLVWNARDRTEAWIDAVWSITDRVEKHAPWRDHEHWSASVLGGRPHFGPLHDAVVHHRQSVTPDQVVDRIASVSHVAVLPPDRHDAVLAEVRRVLETHPGSRGRRELEIPYRVDTFWCERLP